LLPVSRPDRLQVASTGDEELFRVTAKIVVELQDCGGTDPFWVAEPLAHDHLSLIAKHGSPAIGELAKLILASEIPSVSTSFQSLFDRFNEKYFSGALDRYEVHVVFDLHTFADEPIYEGHVSSGLIRFEERRIYIRYTDGELMRKMLIQEMAHAATSREHDEPWLNEIKRLKAAGAPVLHSEFDPELR
jgi:hypothetical protein